jgi:hypothetical protein
MSEDLVVVEVDGDALAKKLVGGMVVCALVYVGGLVATFCTGHWIGRRSVKAVTAKADENSDGPKQEA